MDEPTCSVVEDGRLCGASGKLVRDMCGRHYARWKRHGDPLAGGPTPGDYSWIQAGIQFDDWTATGGRFLKNKTSYVPVACKCGFASEVQAASLANGHSKRCRPCSARLRMTTQTRTITCPRCSTVFRSPSPRSTVCPACRPEHQREVNRNYMQEKGLEYAAEQRRRARGKKFGLTPDEYDRRLHSQNFQCAVCGCDLADGRRSPSMDHDHSCCGHQLTTGRPACGRCARGFLCDGCNMGGGITDSIELLLRKVAYLEYWADRHADAAPAAA